MPLDFPNNPTTNQQYTHPTSGIIWVWDGSKWVSGTDAAPEPLTPTAKE